METNRQLGVSLLQVVVIIAAAVALWRVDFHPLPKGYDFLLWPVVLAGCISLSLDLVFRLQGDSRLGTALRLPSEFGPRTGLFLQMARRALKGAAWSALIVGVLVSLAQTQPEPQVYRTFIVSTAVVLGSTVAVHTVSVPLPAVGLIFRFPWFRLIAFGIVYLLLQQGWAATYGFAGSALLPTLAAAMGTSYVGSALMNAGEVSERWANPDTPVRAVAVECLKLVAAFTSGASVALVAWGLLSALPHISAAALDEWPDFLLGGWGPLHFSRVFDARYMVAGCMLALGFAAKVPSVDEATPGTSYRGLLKAGAYAFAGYLAWLTATKLSPVGHGYALLGAAIAGGLFMAAAAMVVRGLISERVGVLSNVAGWLSQSTLRAFFLGVSIVLYGLLLRPLLYETLWFAPVYEWMVVLAFASVPLNRLRKGVREEVAPEGVRPAAWPNWSRHEQLSEERPDPRMEGLLLLQQRFINTGEWRRVWMYLVGLLLRNEVPVRNIPSVFEPLRRWLLDSSAARLRRPKEGAVRAGREAALEDTMTRMEEALSLPRTPSEKIDETRVRAAAAPFVDLGGGPEELAVTLTAAYWERGADPNSAAALWFPLMTLVDDPGFVAGVGVRTQLRKVFRRVFRRGSPRWDRIRRQRMVDGAVSHLFGDGALEDLPVAVLGRQVTVYESRRGRPDRRLLRGESVEVMEEGGTVMRLRPGDELDDYSTSDPLEREPMLPTDYPVMEQGGG